MSAQSRYWQEFVDLKRDALYIARYHRHVEALDWRLDLFTALTSSGSIAGWVVWRHFAIGWAVIIASSQVLTTVRPLLPYKARLKALSGLSSDLDGLAITAEADWFKVAGGLLTEQEIHDLTMALMRKKLAARSQRFGDASLPERVRLLSRAEAEANQYMLRFDEGEA